MPTPLAPNTRAAYMTKLRKYVKVYPHVVDELQKELCWKEITRLCGKLGIEPDSPLLLRGPGRPRVDAFDLDEAMQAVETRTARKSEDELLEMQRMAGEKKAKLARMVEQSEKAQAERRRVKDEDQAKKAELGEGTQVATGNGGEPEDERDHKVNE
jgi:hypothetical protein